MTASSGTDVVIVGGGVIGLSIGWRALQRGLSVRLLERNDTVGQETSRVAAGMIAPISEAIPSEPALLALALASASAYPSFVEQLEAETSLSTGYRRYGTLFVARDADEAAVLDRDLAFRESLGKPVTRLLASEARRLEPALAPTLRLALEIPDDHAIDPRALTTALARAFTHAGGELVAGAEVSALSVTAGHAHGARLSNGESFTAEHVVIAAGPWSGQIDGVPDTAALPLRPVKGQILALSDPAGPGMLERVLRMQPGYLVPRGDGRYALGASVEERGFDTAITVGPVFDLLRDAIELVPGVSEWRIDELMSASRPGTEDNLPVIGESPALSGLIWATGHHRHGIMLAPITAELVTGQLCGEPLSELAAPVSSARFAKVAS